MYPDKQHLIREGINLRIPVRGSSMFPLLSNGDTVIVSSPEGLKRGDIIIFKKSEDLICHRIVSIFCSEGRMHYITKGDAMTVPDRPVMSDDVIGKVIAIERKRISLPRRVFLLLDPILRPRLLKVFIISFAVSLKGIMSSRFKA